MSVLIRVLTHKFKGVFVAPAASQEIFSYAPYDVLFTYMKMIFDEVVVVAGKTAGIHTKFLIVFFFFFK